MSPQVTEHNEDNQLYLVSESLGCARTISCLLRRCTMEARVESPIRNVLLDASLPAIKVLVNLSHSFRANEGM